MSSKKLRFILGDQLSHKISSLRDADPAHDIILMCEVWDEATYVKHHKKKIAFLFSAMRHFAAELEEKGFTVRYIQLDDPENSHSFTGELKRAVDALQPEKIITTYPGEHRVLKAMEQWSNQVEKPVEIREDDRFLCTRAAFKQWAKDRKNLRMEFFYREMRKEFDLLMDGDQPEGGEWNYDSDNRKSLPKDLDLPTPYQPRPDKITKQVIELVAERFGEHFGDLEPFHFAVTRREALNAFNDFVENRLSLYGDYQDAMKEGEPFLFHSLISAYVNAGLLSPLELVQKVEAAYRDGNVPLNAAEGFIRQIIGWREFIRGIYWLKMPDYAGGNYLNAERKLPEFFWAPEKTDMNCLKQCVTETKENAYAHHIQRLMVLGNFCLLTGIHPDEVNEWYLIVYADAYEWVELPNVSGMILFADGGYLASKPYAAGGAYINRMSDYCKNCKYNVKEKTGETACPFNYLYWNFLDENENILRGNPRLGLVYKNLDKMTQSAKDDMRTSAKAFLKRMK